MGDRMNIILVFLPSLFTFSFLITFRHCTAIDTITTTQYIRDPQTLVSLPDEIFRLGFFNLHNSTNHYVGIWYNNIPGPTIVWVANRDNPLNDSSGVLRITSDGNLVVLDGRGNPFWRTDVSDIASSNTIAELLDSGNLVLREMKGNTKGRILWQSFDHPSDTFLPTMKLGVNLRTGEELALTSWKDTSSDPSTGSFTLKLLNTINFSRIIINAGFGYQRHWLSGPLDAPRISQEVKYMSKFEILRDNIKGTVYLTLGDVDKSVLSRFVLDSDGNIAERHWDDQKKEWQLIRKSPETECDVYGKCGPFGSCNMLDSPICSCLTGFKPKSKDEWESGNWSGGCVRRTELQCKRNNKTSSSSSDGGGKEADGFLTMRFKIYDYFDYWKFVDEMEEGKKQMGYCEDILEKCLNDCSCIAYIGFDYQCMRWIRELINLQVLPSYGPVSSSNVRVLLYLCVAYSELPHSVPEAPYEVEQYKTNKKWVATIIIIIAVLTGIVAIGSGTYFCWRWMAKHRDFWRSWMAKQRDFWRSWMAKQGDFSRWMAKQRSTIHGYYLNLIGRIKRRMRKNAQRERRRREKKKMKKAMRTSIFDMDDAYGESSDTNMLFGDKPELEIFNFENLVIATNNFNEANKLGHGGFGSVYKGKLLDGQEIAVKRLSKSSGQGIQEFKNEVLVISKLQHRNLVRLLGCCTEGEEKILIYEYLPNKSLDAFLFDATKQGILEWRTRFQIIEGISRGILYLHRDSRLRVIHRDLKASNILLDEDLNPKISDFGMARIFGGNELQADTRRIVGTYGYMSPEYVIEGRLSEKSDVFSFGVLLLEIVSGKRNTSFHHQELSLRLLGYAWQLWNEDKAQLLIDPKLLYAPSAELEILRCSHVGLLCVQEFAMDRPTMSTTLSMLTSEIATLPTPKHPAFTERLVSSDSNSSQRNQTIHSINNVTITSVGGR